MRNHIRARAEALDEAVAVIREAWDGPAYDFEDEPEMVVTGVVQVAGADEDDGANLIFFPPWQIFMLLESLADRYRNEILKEAESEE